MALALFRMTDNEAAAFEQARARWDAIRQQRREIGNRLDGAAAALALALNPPGKNEPFSPLLREKARTHLAGRPANPDRLRREIGEFQDQLADLQRSYMTEAEAWRAAVEDEGARVAAAVRPRHRAAVGRIAKAVEALSAAIEAEREVRRELVGLGSFALVDAGHEFGTLAEYNSPLSVWNRRVLGSKLVG